LVVPWGKVRMGKKVVGRKFMDGVFWDWPENFRVFKSMTGFLIFFTEKEVLKKWFKEPFPEKLHRWIKNFAWIGDQGRSYRGHLEGI